MVLSQFKAVLGENGVEEIEPGKGDAFDHNPTKRSNLSRVKKWRQSRSAIDTQGFSLNGRLIRPATVIVSGDASD